MPFTIGGEWIPEPTPKANKKPPKVVKEKRRGSFVTVLLYVSDDANELKKICTELKQRFACGGSVKEGHIELQGDHVEAAKAYLKNNRANPC